MVHGLQVTTSTVWVFFYTLVGSERKFICFLKFRLANKIVRYIVRVAHIYVLTHFNQLILVPL